MNCKTIQDLLPLYRDEVCSQESRQAVDEHIQSCPHCAEVLREMGREEIWTGRQRMWTGKRPKS